MQTNNQGSLSVSPPQQANRIKLLLALLAATCLFVLFYPAIVSGVKRLTGEWTAVNLSPENKKPVAMSGAPSVQSPLGVNDIVTDALAFKAMLTSAQQTTLQLTYTNSLARKWSNLPCGISCRNGLQLGTNLTTAQYAAAMQIVKDALSADANNGYDEFHQMNLAEAYLHANGGGSGYDSTLRWMAFLNTPTPTGAWMLQFGGHHYAANIAFNNGHVIGATPFFMGLEPKTFTYNSVAYDPLGDERSAFGAALASLSSSQLSTALISSSFMDCVMIPGESNGGAAAFPSITIGQPLSSLTTAQQNLVLAIIQKYTSDMDTATANNVYAGYAANIASTYISYHGSGSSGSASSFLVAQGDYGRISGPNVWIEFSCQGGIVIAGQIHYHTVWRDRSHDYGVDLTGASIDGGGSTTGVTSINFNNTLSVYPNPATSEANLNLPNEVSNAIINVTDMQGKTVYLQERFSGQKLTIDLHSLAKGTYILKVSDNEHFYSGKFVRQ